MASGKNHRDMGYVYPVKKEAKGHEVTFNQKKSELKTFSQNIPDTVSLPILPTSSGWFGTFNYKVTGSDLNDMSDKIQKIMIEQNKVLIDTKKEFMTIYDTFTALDTEYIQGILSSLKGAEEANRKAMIGLKKGDKNLSEIRKDQADIQNLIKKNEAVVNVLKKFQERMEKIEHIADIDKLYSDFYLMDFEMGKISNEIISIQTSIDNMQDMNNNHQEFLVKLQDRHYDINKRIDFLEESKFDILAFENSLIKEKEKINNTVTDLKKELNITRIVAFSGVISIVVLLSALLMGVL